MAEKKERKWKNKSYWNMKKETLEMLCKERGLEVDTEKRDEMAKALLKADENAGETAEVGVENQETGEKESMPKQAPLAKVQFHNVREGEAPYVFLGHNGKAFYIPKEVPVIIPKFLLDSCVKDAIEHRLTPQVKENGNIVYKATPVQRFPYTFIEMVDMEEVEKLKG